MGCLGVFLTANFVGLRNLKLITALDLDLYPGSLCIKFSFFIKEKVLLMVYNLGTGVLDSLMGLAQIWIKQLPTTCK